MALRTPYDEKADEEYAPGPGHDRASGRRGGPDSQTTPAGDPFDPRGDLQDKETGGGRSSSTSTGKTPFSYNPKGDTPKANDLKDREESPGEDSDDDKGGFFNASPNSSSTSKRRVRFTKRRAAVGGGITAMVIAGVVGISSIVQGPFQLVHLGEILKKNLFGTEQSTASRTKGLFRYARSGEYGETRLGSVGSKFFHKYIDQLKEIGVEFQTGSGSVLQSATIDTGKLAEKYPELKGMTPDEARSFLAEKFPSLSIDQLQHVSPSGVSGGHIFEVDARDFSVKDSLGLISDSGAQLGSGKTITAIKMRPLAKFFNLPSLWHPEQRALAKKVNAYFTKADRAKTVKEEAKALEPPDSGKLALAKENLKSRLDGNEGKLSAALLASAGVCIVRDVADDVPTVNRGAIVVPAAIKATSKEALASQAQSGNDITIRQAGAQAESLVDANGKSIWAAKALTATYDPTTQTGQDIPPEYQQAFSKDTTAQTIKSTVGGGSIGGLLCSPFGQVIQIAGSITLLLAGPFTGGASWGIAAARAGAGVAATSGVIGLLKSQLVDKLKNNSVVPDVLSGPLGGNLLAFGARESSNIGARASGGVELSSTQSAALDRQEFVASQQDYKNKSFFAQMFDINDYRTPAAKLADSLDSVSTKNLNNMATSFLNIGSVLPHLFSSLAPKAHAANQPYDWAYPRYGIPDELLNDPALADPYDNADKVAVLLDSGLGGYADRAKTCFGVDIAKGADGWQVTDDPAMAGSGGVNPNDSSYADAQPHCNDLSDPNWKRMILFVFDSRTMDAIDCYQGDSASSDQSCSNVGYTPAADTSTQSSPSSVAAVSFKIGTYNLLGASHTDPGGDTQAYDSYDVRMTRAVKIMKDNGFEVAGLQELESKQRTKLLQLAGDTYDIYPTTDITTNRFSENSIIWDKSKFSLEEGGKTTIAYNATLDRDIPWVKLKDKGSGQTFYVFNTHDPVNKVNADFRVKDARIHLTDLEGKLQTGSPVFMTGDFNSSYSVTSDDLSDRSLLTYCILTSTGKIKDSYDAFKGRDGACPTTDLNAIDHVYLSNDVSVSSWDHISDVSDKKARASDHAPVIASVSFGGGLASGTAKDLAAQLLPYIQQGKISCNGGESHDCSDIQNTATGTSIRGGKGCMVDSLQPGLLGLLLGVAKAGHTVILSALCSDHYNDGLRGHAGGRAADFNYVEGVFLGEGEDAQGTVPWTAQGAVGQKKTQVDQKLLQDVASFMPKSTGFGQTQCHAGFSFLSGFKTFPDGCHHQHIQVET